MRPKLQRLEVTGAAGAATREAPSSPPVAAAAPGGRALASSPARYGASPGPPAEDPCASPPLSPAEPVGPHPRTRRRPGKGSPVAIPATEAPTSVPAAFASVLTRRRKARSQRTPTAAAGSRSIAETDAFFREQVSNGFLGILLSKELFTATSLGSYSYHGSET